MRVIPETQQGHRRAASTWPRSTRSRPGRRCRAASSTRRCRSTSSNVALVCGSAAPTRVGYRFDDRRQEGPGLPQVRGGHLMADDRAPAATQAPPQGRVRRRDQARSCKETLGLGNVDAGAPRSTKIVVNMGVGQATQQASLLDGAVTDLHDHHRPEADGHQGQEVDRRLQAARGQRHRRQGDAARRPDVGVLRPARSAWPSPASATSGASTPTASTGRQLHVRGHRAAGLPGDRLRQDRQGPRHGHHDRHDGPHRTRRAGRCSTPSASRSAATGAPQERTQVAKKALIDKQQRKPKFKVRGYTRCRRCGRARRCTATSACAASACARWPTPARCPASRRRLVR